ncbi:Hypothetical protein D9617_23g006330 [Elsinoe fawcettii]|nr:Hypothetical protein D9617_23g006330 [Elsinoe fawcettii]
MAQTCDDEEYEIPLRDQRYFGAGIKRKRVPFVPASDNQSQQVRHQATTGEVVRNTYLDIVMNTARIEEVQDSVWDHASSNIIGPESLKQFEICHICSSPIGPDDDNEYHAGSIAHQLCLPHNHPPSALDRQRKGMNILESRGWDPDLREGLGAAGQGRLYPIRVQAKSDRLGLRHESEDRNARFVKRIRPERPSTQQKLDAGKIRQLETAARKKDARLRDLFYRDDDVGKYLGGG